ncbi:hypothetical protein GCM10027047_23590 [Rhodococcus aerolatus]
MATTETTTPPTTATELPARLRVHALAKLLGVTSKQVLADLAGRGLEVKSAQSSVDRATAEQVRDALAPAEQAPAGEPAVGTDAGTDAALPTAQVDSGPAPLPDLAEPDTDGPTDPAVVPLFLPPEPVKAPPRRRRATRAAAAPADTGAEDAEVAGATTAEPTETDTTDTGTDGSSSAAGDDADDDSGPRRRRRGRRGRGRGRGPADGENDTSEDDATGDTTGSTDTGSSDSESAAAATTAPDAGAGDVDAPAADAEQADGATGEQDGDGSDDGDDAGSGSRRRRRRRRRRGGDADGAGSDGSGDGADGDKDAGADTAAEREPRSKSRRSRGGSSGSGSADEVQGITGSTRLEAKRQRRKDGRDQGRRRPPILSEAEFLARREAVARTMVVRERPGHGDDALTQVAVLEDGVLVEHFVTSSGTPSMVGNIYLGRVQNVLPSMEAAFIDVGRGRNGVLYAGEVDWEAAGLGGRSRKIEQALSSGDLVLVQVSKDPVGHKGARLTTQISLPGRFLVYVPGGTSAGISRKLPDTERSRLKAILKKIVPEDAGVIIRTASEGVAEEELARDVDRLQAQWEAISAEAETVKASGQKSPHSLYEEPDLLVKVVRDLFNSDVEQVVVSGDDAWRTVSSYVHDVSPDLEDRLRHHEGGGDVFAEMRVDEQLTKALERKVMLPSGGSLVIDRTEAMTVVDVNTGKYTGSGGNLEETVTRNNLEAAEEVVRQMRLRDIGGMIVVDFIDMVLEGNRELVLRRLTECLGRDRTRHQVSEVTSLGLVQMTRKKMGQGLVESFSTPCEHCHGRGVVIQSEPVQATDSSGGGSNGSSGGSSGGDTGGRRSRRGGRAEPVPETPPARVVPKGPHPAFLAAAKASAAQNGDDSGVVTGGTDTAGTAENGATAAVTTGSAPQADPSTVVATEPGADAPAAAPTRARRSRRASRPTAAPDTVTEVVDATVPDAPEPDDTAQVDAAQGDAAQDGTAQVDPAQDGTAQVGTAQVDAGPAAETPPAAPTRARRSRRASRPTAAPDPVTPDPVTPDEPAPGTESKSERESQVEAEVVVAEAADSSVPADDEPAAAEQPVAEQPVAPEPVVAPVRPRRRRAAGRPAGPPVGADA